MKHFGDITQIHGDQVPIVDVITGGSPCQDLSVAGKRAGLAGERSGLFMEQIRIIKEMRDESRRRLSAGGTDVDIRPRYMVWENVPGAFSSNKGEDFRAVLEETAKVADKDAVIPGPPKGKWAPAGCIVGDGWSVAWRVHDAQYWGVPQRRKRICLLADFNGGGAGQILFELRRETEQGDTEQTVMDSGAQSGSEVQSVAEGLSGHTEASGETREDIASDAGTGTSETGRCLNGWDVQSKHIQPENEVAESLYAGECRGGGGESYVMQSLSFQERAGKPGGGKGILIQEEHTGALSTLNNQSVCCLNDQGGSIMGVSEDITGALRAQEHGHQPIVFEPGAASRVGGHVYEDDVAGTVRANFVVESEPYTSSKASYHQHFTNDGKAETLVASDYKDPPTVTYGLDRASFNQGANAKYDFAVEEEKIATQVSRGPGAVLPWANSVVRRLTPKECERLQGFDDDWTNIGEWVDSKGKKHKDADSPRYKALGNSIALPFWAWLADRLAGQYRIYRPTMASLFDGIGGFPVSFGRAGFDPVWASEIEEFPIAVTKIHFPDVE